jgi:hypothetical protein
MTGKESEQAEPNPEKAPDGKPEGAAAEAKGIKSRLTDAQKEMLASKSRGGTTTQSVGHSHKPTHTSGKQGPAEKKVRW